MSETQPSVRSLVFFYINTFATLLVGNMFTYTLILLSREMGGSHSFTGLVLMANYLPTLIFGLVAGALLDRISRMFVAYFAQAFFLVTTWTLTYMLYTGALQPESRWSLVLISAVNGTALTFLIPARLAILANLVPEGSAGRATIILNVLIILGFGFGPLVTGLLRDQFPWSEVMLITAIGYVFAYLMLVPVRPRNYERSAPANVFAAFAEGARYAWKTPLIREMIALQMIVFLLIGPIQALMPEFARTTLGLSEGGRGAYMASLGGGLFAGGIAARVLHGMRRRGRVMLISAVVMCVLLALSGLQTTWPPAALCMGLSGLAGGLLGALIPSALQVAAPDYLRGRIMGLYGIVFQLMPGLGAVAAGRAADALGGAGQALLFGGASLGLVALFASLLLGQVRRYD